MSYDHINFKPPQNVADAAKKGLEWRKKTGEGGLSVDEASKEGIGSGVQRAVNLKNRDTLSPSTVKRMKAFFDRHQKNKSVSPGKEPWEDKGAVAWALWGGDAGYSWAKKVVEQMEKADKKSSRGTNMEKIAKFITAKDRQVGKYKHFENFESFGQKVKDFVQKKTNQAFTVKKKKVEYVGPVYYMYHRDGNIIAMYEAKRGRLDINEKYL